MGNYKFTGKEFRVGYLLYKGKTYAEISNTVKCSNRIISDIKTKIRQSGVNISRNRKHIGYNRPKNSKKGVVSILGTPNEVVKILHKAIRTRLISNAESNRLLYWLVNGR